MRKKDKTEKKEWNNYRWIELAVVLLAVFMVLLCWKEYQLQKQMETNVLREQNKMGSENFVDRTQAEQQKQFTEQAYGNEKNNKDEQNVELEKSDKIRVLLMDNNQKSYAQKRVSLQSSGRITIEGTYSGEVEPGMSCDVSDILISDGIVFVKSEYPITVLSLERSQGNPVYEEVLEISRRGDEYYIVNEVDLETYLKYVVPSEMPASYPAEALKAQAVCARTYAVRQMQEGRLNEYGADVDDTVAYQVYNNISRQDATDLAVDETKGKIMCCNEEPVQAYFFSTSCGFTSVDDVWSGNSEAQYLKSIPVSRQTVEALSNNSFSDASVLQHEMTEEEFEKIISEKNSLDYECDEPWYRWSVTVKAEEIKSRVSELYPEIGQLQDMKIQQRSSGGAAKQLLLTGTSGTTLIETEYGIREFLSPGEEPIQLQDGSDNTSMKILPSAYIVIETIKENDEPSAFCIYGGGYGHGVGMSQNGAKYLAKDGLTWQQILSVFYKNFVIVSM